MTSRRQILIVGVLLAAVWAGLGLELRIETAKIRENETAVTSKLFQIREENRRLIRLQADGQAEAAAKAAASKPTPTPALLNIVSRIRSGAVGVPRAAAALRRGASPDMPWILDYTGKLRPGFSLLFGLSDTQAAALQGKLDSIKQRLDTEILQAATVVGQTPNSIRIDVLPVPDSDALRDEYLQALRDGLGDEGYSAFAELNTQQPVSRPAWMQAPRAPPLVTGQLFNNFGGSSRQIAVSKSEGVYGIVLDIQRGGGGTSPTLGTFDAYLGPLRSLLPPDF